MRVDPTTTQAEPEGQSPPGAEGPGTGEPKTTEGEHWSPFSTSRVPLGFYLGIGLIISGLVITRIYLSKIES